MRVSNKTAICFPAKINIRPSPKARFFSHVSHSCFNNIRPYNIQSNFVSRITIVRKRVSYFRCSDEKH